MKIVLFTDSYPYDDAKEGTFLEHEICHLTNAFNKVTIVPYLTSGKYYEGVPQDVVVNLQYSKFMKKYSTIKRLLTFYNPIFIQEIINRPKTHLQPRTLMRLLSYAFLSEKTKEWVKKFIVNEKINVEETIFYTYWFNYMTTGIGLLKKEYPKLCLISRAHGGDIYLERHNPPYIPCRDMSLSMVDHIFTASRDGEYYLKKRYPLYSSLFESSYLGVSDPMFSTKYSTDNILRIVSCSSLVPVKRVELILEGVLYTAKTNPGKRFEWHHFGDGPLQEKFNKAIKSKSYSNVAINFMGFQPRNIILNFYRDNPVDVFINTSSSEGGNPVSIMEAISCGIPVIATKVGGNMEIVSEENGLLLSCNPTNKEIADALLFFANPTPEVLRKRENSYRIFKERYWEKENYPKFIKRIQEIHQKTQRLSLTNKQ